jgi:hypothetical protein
MTTRRSLLRGGLASLATATVAKKMFMTRWDRKAVDAQWRFLAVAQRTGIIDKIPAQDKYALFVTS